MAQLSAEPKQSPAEPQPLFPPEERFWQRYSPHHEFPISTVGAVALFGLVVGLMILLAYRLAVTNDGKKPAEMVLVGIWGGDGDGDGRGTGDNPFALGAKGKLENIDAANPQSQPSPVVPNLANDIRAPALQVPESWYPPDSSDPNAFAALDRAIQAAEASMTVQNPPPVAKVAKASGGGGKGEASGKGGPGSSKGKGGKGPIGVGPGDGVSPFGQKLTKSQTRQMRWRILASFDGNVHLAKLKALKVTLVIPSSSPGVLRVIDLGSDSLAGTTRKHADILQEYRDKVWWQNRDPKEIGPLAAVLGLQQMPQSIFIFLPKSLEDRMVELEREYSRGRSEAEIELTTWDVTRLADGRYKNEPEVVDQQLRGR